MSAIIHSLPLLLVLGDAFAAEGLSPGRGDHPATNAVQLILAGGSNEIRAAQKALELDRKAAIDALLAVVNAPISKGELFWQDDNPRNAAMAWLGAMRAAEAIPALLGCISPREGQTAWFSMPERLFCPAAEALAEIGLPAFEPLLAYVKGGPGRAETQQAGLVLARILGGDLAEFKAKAALIAEEDDAKRRNLRRLLDSEVLRRRLNW